MVGVTLKACGVGLLQAEQMEPLRLLGKRCWTIQAKVALFDCCFYVSRAFIDSVDD